MNPYNVIAHVQYSLFRKCMETGWKINTRALADHELVLITDGSGQMVTDTDIYALKKGTLLYLYPGLKHSLSSCNDNPLSFYGVHFSYVNVEYFNNQWNCYEGKDVLPIKMISEVFAYLKIEEYFKKVNQYWNEKASGFEMICRGALMEILYNIIHDSEANYSSRLKVEMLLAYINNNLHNKITIVSLAKMANWSPDYLTVQFKNITGFTVIQYINRCRIDHAKIMLLNGELQIKDIASKVGFCDEFYFSKVFKRHVGVSPSNFLKGIR